MSNFDQERIKDIAEFLANHQHCDRCGQAIVSKWTLCKSCWVVVTKPAEESQKEAGK